MVNGLNQHYATLLGLGEKWRVTNVDLNVLGRRINIYLEYAKDCAPCPECGTLCPVYDQRAVEGWHLLGLFKNRDKPESVTGRNLLRERASSPSP